MGRPKKKSKINIKNNFKEKSTKIKLEEEILATEAGNTNKIMPDERKGIYDEITKELQSTFSQPKFGLKNRSMNVMARIDEKTSKILDALVELELAPSRSAAAAYLISEGILRDKEKYIKILDSYETIKQAKAKAQYSFFKSMIEEESEDKKYENIDSENID